MNKLILTLLSIFIGTSFVSAQSYDQTLRGRVMDKETKIALPFTNVGVYRDSVLLGGASSDMDGYYRIEKVPTGRYQVKASYLGYRPAFLSDVILQSGRETILNIEMEESAVAIKEVVIQASRKHESVNDMTTVSSRTFSVDETNRYAGSRGDPARMASNFAGVQGGDDSRNDIVVRGNSPMGVLWRMNDVDIPNPNHFAVPGTTGGPVSVLNNKMFENSDFMTGAFAAEYGNSTAGVFDLRMRNGNNEKHEFSGQFGFLGTEILAEGPISKKNRSSYLATYRYSTLKAFDALNIPIGTEAVPNYQDLSFKINMPAGKTGNFSLFGVAGKSKIDIVISEIEKPQDEIYGDKDRDQYFGSDMAIVGISHSISPNAKTFTKTTLSMASSKANTHHDLVYWNTSYKVDSLVPKLDYRFVNGKTGLSWFMVRKFNAKNSIKTGFQADMLSAELVDSNYLEKQFIWDVRLNENETYGFVQPYIQWKHKANDNLTFNTGVHAQYLALNGSTSVEPRAGLRWNFKPNQTLSLGTGMHSQMIPAYIYFYQSENASGVKTQQNRDLDFSRSIHYVAGYDNLLTRNVRMKIEVYYQQLYNIPVDTFPSSFSIINEGSTFSRFFPGKLVNDGTGTNAGAEFTLERFYSKHYFFMYTASVYDSRYKGSDGIDRNTDYNGMYAMNLLGSREIPLGNKGNTMLSTGGKITIAGGRRYTPVNDSMSFVMGEVVELDKERNSLQFRQYFRLDSKIGLIVNTKKLTHEIAVDLVNILGTKNILRLSYIPDPVKPEIREEYQLGFLPLFYYKVDFKWGTKKKSQG